MQWLTGLALLPALMCAVMMGGMGLAAALGLRRTQHASAHEADDGTASAGLHIGPDHEPTRR